MADALDNIFSTIFQSEMIAEVGKKKSKEVKDGIQLLKERINKQKELIANHVEKRSQLELAIANLNIHLKINKIREESMIKELEVSKEKLKYENTKYDEVTKAMADLCNTFVEDVDKFSDDYSPCSAGFYKRVCASKEYLKSLEIEKCNLELEIQRASDENVEIKNIIDQKSNKTDELKAISESFKTLQKDINDEIVITYELDSRISQLVIEPDIGADFIKLKEDLQSYDTTEIQSEIKQLQDSLNSLSKIVRNKEAQSLRLQYKQWQRQQAQNKELCIKKEAG